MTKFINASLLSMVSVGLLSACGGATTTATTSYNALTSTSGGTATVTAITLDTGATSAGTASGTFNHATAVATLGGSGIALDTAGALSNDTSTSRYSYVAGLNTTDDYKVVAVATDISDLPSNVTVVYNGQALVTVTDATATYEGTMDSTVTANFGTTGNTVTVALDSISNATITAATTPNTYRASGAEDITFANLDLSGNGFSAGAGTTAVVDGFGGVAASIDTSGATLTAAGVFAGPSAEEVAGAATVDAAAGTALVTFTGAQ